jgi:hypothetical protein
VVDAAGHKTSGTTRTVYRHQISENCRDDCHHGSDRPR